LSQQESGKVTTMVLGVSYDFLFSLIFKNFSK